MKLSEFKSEIQYRIAVLKANLYFVFQNDMAYAGNNWGSMFTTVSYTLAAIFFTKIMFSHVETIAGYSGNELLFFFFVSQVIYYLNWIITMNNLKELVIDVNQGKLDLVLTKPLPHLFYLMSRKISILSVCIQSIPAMTLLGLSIDWISLSISLSSTIAGLLIMLMGFITIHCFQFLGAILAFWFGESENIVTLLEYSTNRAGAMIPFEGYSPSLQLIFSTVVPVIISTEISVSVFLGKSNFAQFFTLMLFVMTAFILLRSWAWSRALKAYTSASS